MAKESQQNCKCCIFRNFFIESSSYVHYVYVELQRQESEPKQTISHTPRAKKRKKMTQKPYLYLVPKANITTLTEKD